MKNEGVPNALARLFATGAALALVTGGLTACVGTPTYGTGTRADVQLLEDVTGMISLGPDEKQNIAYNPRPKLVEPADKKTLPKPQNDIRTASAGAWPESPEERRERVRAYADANSDNIDYRPVVTGGGAASVAASERGRRDDVAYMAPSGLGAGESAQRAEFEKRLQEGKQGSPTQRRFLSEPPLDYRLPSSTAPANELGEDEWKKERDRKAAARKQSGQTSWRDWIPGL
ncbi:hypothetical protein [Mesorhizobium xinjiangense]|uniref:hypothetical protein n=1 Tax=Mesorhizobium xinjiangense TaxID=2678685 RepID=UPI001F2A5082|nr:hypothetical protein [Mesorhizobium xinjiangense]